MSSSPAPKLLTLGDIFDLLKRRPLPCAAAALGTLLGVLAVLSRTTPVYEASASLSIDRGERPVDWQVDPDTGKIEFGMLNTQRDLLLSQSVLVDAMKTPPFTEDPIYRKSDDPVAKLSHRIKVVTSRDTWVITALLRDEDVSRAEAQLTAVIDAFLASQERRQAGKSKGALQFLSDQVIEYKHKLEEARSAEARFRVDNGIISTDPDHNFLAEEISSHNSRRAELHAEMAGNQALMDQLAAAGKAPEGDARIEALLRIEPIRTNPVVIEQQRNLFALLNQRNTLAQKYLPKHPRMVEGDTQIASQRELLAQAVAMASSAIVADHEKLSLQEKDVSDTISRKEKELADYREKLAALQALSTESDSTLKTFVDLSTRKEQEDVSSRMNVAQVAVVDPPYARPKPVNISTLKFLAIAVLAAGAMGVAVPLLFEGLDTRVRGALAAQLLTRLPLLGKAPRVPRLAPLGKGGDPERPHALAEAYRNLRAGLRLAKRHEAGCHVLVISSCRPYEGKSTVAARMAVSLASSGAKVLLVDADMRKPTLDAQLGERCERGLSAALEGEKAVRLAPTSYPNLDYLGVGARPRNPGDLLHSPQLRELVFAWRQAYDHVIFDSPPLGPVADAMVLGEVSDGIVLVVRDHFTTKANIRVALARLAPLSHKVLGVILNGERGGDESYGYYARSARLATVEAGKKVAGAAAMG
jgi:capsular exopolysaccharide synthesis family protein